MFMKAILIALLAFVVFCVVHLYMLLGFHKHFHQHHPGECRRVKGGEFGSEDMEVTSDGLAFITSGVELPTMDQALKTLLNDNGVKGRILLFDFNKPISGARELKIVPTKDLDLSAFRPHGISMIEDRVKGEHVLYVVNHAVGSTDRVEKFRFSPESQELIHIKSIPVSEEMTTTNDLAVVGDDQFYITHFMYFSNPMLSLLEFTVPYPLGGVFFYNGQNFTAITPRLHVPNGVILSRDKRFMYVAVTSSESVFVYERKGDNSVSLVQTVPMFTSLDNFQVNMAGDALYVGAHPILHKFEEHMGDLLTQIAPSSVLRLPLKDGKIVENGVTELFYDHGSLISGSSVANVYNNKLLIGSVLNKLALCDGNGNTQF